MKTVVVDGTQSAAINEAGTWYGAVDKNLYFREAEIQTWLSESYIRGDIGELKEFLDYGRVYFRSERDLLFFILKWA